MSYTGINEDFAKLISESKHARKKLDELRRLEHKYKHNIIIYRTGGYTTKHIGYITAVDFESGYFDIRRIDYNETVRLPIDKTSEYSIIDSEEIKKALPDKFNKNTHGAVAF